MPKVNGKRDAKMQGGAGEMLVGRMATRALARDLLEASNNARQALMSLPEYKEFEKWMRKFKKHYNTDDEKIERFKIWRAKKEWIDAENSIDRPGGLVYGLNMFSDLTPRESSKYLLCKRTVDPYKGLLRTPQFYSSPYGKEVAKEEVAFEKWVTKHGKNYASKREREDKFAAYFQNKKMIEEFRKQNPGCYLAYPDELDMKMDCVLSSLMLKNLLNSSAPSNDGSSAPSNDGSSAPSNDGSSAPSNDGCSAPSSESCYSPSN